MNLPSRSYWSETPERREELLKWLLWFGLWVGCLVQAFLIAGNVSVFQANRAVPPVLPQWGGWSLTIVFLVGLLIWIRSFVRLIVTPRANLR
jgi:hypothetical protein